MDCGMRQKPLRSHIIVPYIQNETSVDATHFFHTVCTKVKVLSHWEEKVSRIYEHYFTNKSFLTSVKDRPAPDDGTAVNL